MKEAEKIKRPQSKDFFSTVIEMNEAFLNEPKLYQFIRALDNYIDHLEENLSSPQEVTDGHGFFINIKENLIFRESGSNEIKFDTSGGIGTRVYYKNKKGEWIDFTDYSNW